MTAAVTCPLAEAAERIGCSERWLADQLRAGRFPARKIGRQWRMTDADIEAAIDICQAPRASAPMAPVGRIGLTPTSRRRVASAS